MTAGVGARTVVVRGTAQADLHGAALAVGLAPLEVASSLLGPLLSPPQRGLLGLHV